jgi:ABC-2 type transport system permease protein
VSTLLPATLDVSGTATVPLTRLVRVELRKSYDTRAGFWLLVAIGAIVGIVLGIFTIVTLVYDEPIVLGDWIVVAAYLTSVLLPILAIMLVTAEWTQRSALVTFSLEPRRERVVLAKLLAGVVLTLATLVVASLIGIVLNLVCEIAQPDTTGWEVAAGDLAGFVVTQTLAMLGGFALAALLLNTPAAIVLFFVYRYVLPGVFAAANALIGGFDAISPWLDFQAAQRGLFSWEISGAEEWGQLVVSGVIWLVLPLAIGLWRIHRAEVK